MGNSAFSWRPTTGVKIKIGTFTRDLTAASGDVSYTDVGFMPDNIIFFGSDSAGDLLDFDIGMTNGTTQVNLALLPRSAPITYPVTGRVIISERGANDGTKRQIAVLKSFDPDGFTLTWTKTSTPSGTYTGFYIAFANQAALEFTGSSIPAYKNLAMAYASATTLTATADYVTLLDSNLNAMTLAGLSETLDITTSGINGLDTGSEAVSTWYHIWAIAKPDGTLNCLLSASATAPTLPAGYTFKCYLGAVYNNSSGNFVEFYQRENKVVQTITKVLNGGTQTSLTSVNVAAVIPTTAKAVFGNLYQTAGGYWIYLSACNSLIGNLYTAGEHWMSAPYWLPMITAQTLWYKTDNAAVAVHIWISGWEY